MADIRQGIKKHDEKEQSCSAYIEKEPIYWTCLYKSWLIGFYLSIISADFIICILIYEFQYVRQANFSVQIIFTCLQRMSYSVNPLKVTFIYVFLSVPLKLVSALLVAIFAEYEA